MRFVAACAEAAEAVSASVVESDLFGATAAAARVQPLLIAVTDDVYTFDRGAFNRLALDANAPLVVWSDDLAPADLAPLLAAAIQRRS